MAARDKALSRVLCTARRFQADFTAKELKEEYRRNYAVEIPQLDLDPTEADLNQWLRNGGSALIKGHSEGRYHVEEILAFDGQTVRSRLVSYVEVKEPVSHYKLSEFCRTKFDDVYMAFGFKKWRNFILSFPEVTTDGGGYYKIDSEYGGNKETKKQKKGKRPLVVDHVEEEAPKKKEKVNATANGPNPQNQDPCQLPPAATPTKYDHFGQYIASLLNDAAARNENPEEIMFRILAVIPDSMTT